MVVPVITSVEKPGGSMVIVDIIKSRSRVSVELDEGKAPGPIDSR